MNIHEMEKRATPGPMFVISMMLCVRGADDVPYAIAEVMDNERCVPLRIEREANAALLAHCRNHFIELLEAVRSLIYDGRSLSATHHPESGVWAHAEEILASAEAVEEL